MPHFGLMKTADSFDLPEGALLRARLHIRGARRRLREGKVAAGIVTLYDALIFALRWYFMAPEHQELLKPAVDMDLTDERNMFAALIVSDITDESFDLASFNALVERAAHEELPGYDYRPVLESFEALMMRLGVMPFDEAELPPEDPATF